MNLQLHDMNNQLNIILGICYKLRSSQNTKDHLGQSLGLIEHSVYRANVLIKEITQGLAEPDKYKSLVNITDILHRVVHILSLMVNKDVIVEFNEPETPFYIYGYAQDLEQAFLNLLMNAKDAIGERGDIFINTEFLPVIPAHGQGKSDMNHNETLRVTISDTGPGIPDSLKNFVFEPFFTTKAKSGGMGLGLSIVAKVFREHNCIISYGDTNEKSGTEVVIEIPGDSEMPK